MSVSASVQRIRDIQDKIGWGDSTKPVDPMDIIHLCEAFTAALLDVESQIAQAHYYVGCSCPRCLVVG